MIVELSSDEINVIAIALKREAKQKVMETEISPRDDQIINAANSITLANRLLDQGDKEKE